MPISDVMEHPSEWRRGAGCIGSHIGRSAAQPRNLNAFTGRSMVLFLDPFGRWACMHGTCGKFRRARSLSSRVWGVLPGLLLGGSLPEQLDKHEAGGGCGCQWPARLIGVRFRPSESAPGTTLRGNRLTAFKVVVISAVRGLVLRCSDLTWLACVTCNGSVSTPMRAQVVPAASTVQCPLQRWRERESSAERSLGVFQTATFVMVSVPPSR